MPRCALALILGLAGGVACGAEPDVRPPVEVTEGHSLNDCGGAPCTTATDPSVVVDGAAGPLALRVTSAPMLRRLSRKPLAAGRYRLHLIDVGTGLSILVQGPDFNLLWDGGSADPDEGQRRGARNRLLAYLHGALGSSTAASDPECQPTGDPADDVPVAGVSVLDHVFLSHPHADHGVFLADVLRCYPVRHVWDAGVQSDTAFYQAFLEAVRDEPEVVLHTAADLSASAVFQFGAGGADPVRRVDLSPLVAQGRWKPFATGDREALGALGAHLRVLHADAGVFSDVNQNSTVLRLHLHEVGVLLMGDAESTATRPPKGAFLQAPTGLQEKAILDRFGSERGGELDGIKFLQLGHHGSTTSSSRDFLLRVRPEWALVGAGPKVYGDGVTFPDAEVVTLVAEVIRRRLNLRGPATSRVIRTDTEDRTLAVDSATCGDRIGLDDKAPGGCDNWVFELDGTMAPVPLPDAEWEPGWRPLRPLPPMRR